MITFTLPDFGNSITEADIKAAQIRITVKFKEYFPKGNCDLTVKIHGKKFIISYKDRTTGQAKERSNLLKLGREALEELGLKPNDSVKVTKIDDST